MTISRGLSVAAVAIAVASIATFAMAQRAAPVQWEYYFAEWNQIGADGFNRLGAQGWELVAVDTELKSTADYGSAGETHKSETYYYFKRPRQ